MDAIKVAADGFDESVTPPFSKAAVDVQSIWLTRIGLSVTWALRTIYYERFQERPATCPCLPERGLGLVANDRPRHLSLTDG